VGSVRRLLSVRSRRDDQKRGGHQCHRIAQHLSRCPGRPRSPRERQRTSMWQRCRRPRVPRDIDVATVLCQRHLRHTDAGTPPGPATSMWQRCRCPPVPHIIERGRSNCRAAGRG
jgi:hypothetical protein